MIETRTLKNYALFGGLTEEQIDKIFPLVAERQFEPGEIILTEGTPNDKILFILDGKVSVVKGGMVVYDLPEGHTFGEMEALDIMPSETSAVAVTDVKVIIISSKSLRDIYQVDNKMGCLLLMNLARNLSRRLRVANEVINDHGIYESYSTKLLSKESKCM